MNDHFCAGGFFKFFEDQLCVLGVTDERYLTSVKMPGGTNKNARWESPEQTLCREFPEETGYTPLTFSKVHQINVGSHTKIFYLVENAEGDLRLGDVKKMTEADGQKISVRWWSIEEFSKSLNPSYREAFEKVVVEKTKSDELVKNYLVELALTSSEFYMQNSRMIDLIS